MDYLQLWLLEVIFALVLALFWLSYWYGQRENTGHARAWIRLVKDSFGEQFSHVDPLTRYGSNQFDMFCTGRINCLALEARLRFLPRQDLLTRVSTLFLAATDMLSFEIALPDSMSPLILAVFPVSKEKRWRDHYEELKYTKPRAFSEKSDLVWLCDGTEIATSLTPEILQLFETVRPWLHLVFVSDCHEAKDAEYKQVAQLVFKFPGTDANANSAILRLVFRLIDVFGSFRLPGPVADKRRKKRLDLRGKTSHEAEKENAEKLALEKLQREREALEKLGPAERAKAEEKIAKRDLKRKMKSKVKMIKQ